MATEQKTKVSSIIKKNEDIRNEMMRRNDMYLQYYQSVSSPFSKLYQKNTFTPHSNTDGKTLFDYTFDQKTPYSINITKNLPSNKENYLEYYSRVYGKELGFNRWVRGLLSINDIKYALQENEVGVVRDFNLVAALGGAVITNLNNLSGTDTPLGQITSQMFAYSMYANSEFNTLREGDKKYITPSLYKVYGNNSANVNELSDILHVGRSGRIDIKGLVKDTQVQSTYFDEQMEQNKYFNKQTYIPLVQKNGIDTVLPLNETADKNDSIYHEEGLIDNSRMIDDATKPLSLLSKTNKLFKEGIIKSSISKFYINEANDRFDNAVRKGTRSRGRSLLAKNEKNGNPYARSWTALKQYEKIDDLIRLDSDYLDWALDNRLKEKTVLDVETKLVNITPTRGNIDIKKCMFSIENLAWKDVPKELSKISVEQRGPLGGRIMWFPPYDLNFQENVSVNWNQNQFIGRGENIYTYSNTERSGSLSFTMLIDHPNIINYLQESNKDKKELEEDVLRYFAGAQRLEMEKGLNDATITKIDLNDIKSYEPTPITNPEKNEKIIFYIFFPFGYSGNWNDMEYTDKQGKVLDSDWIDYLLGGRNIIWDNFIRYNGYETFGDDVQGISYEDDEESYENEIIKIKGKGITEYKIYFRVDNDFLYQGEDGYLLKNNKKIPIPQICFDKESFGLNKISYLSNTSADTSVDTYCYSFLETMLALDAMKNYSFNEGDVFTTTKIEYYLKNEINKDEIINNIKELYKKFKNATKDININVSGFGGEIENTLLSEGERWPINMRRMSHVAWALKDYFPDAKYEYSHKLVKEIFTENDYLINNQFVKEGRCVKVEISLNIPQIESNVTSDNIDDVNIELEPLILEEYDMPIEKPINGRYEDEFTYFSKLEKEDPIIFKNVVDKYKYFNPAFHSITPEGFNARLTFLHQCTRQGGTISPTSTTALGRTMENTAGNLSFGRMPVCVLRIGDFFKSKIIIDSMSIDYQNNGGIQWDLNADGAGVQPMMAKINLGIKILGGQTLDGPIDKLQNAVSFNYYANAETYDDRADRMHIDENGKIIYDRIWDSETELVENPNK